jgi:hypothetical protein
MPLLTSFVRDATRGVTPSTMVLTAGPGTGKTRVLDELPSGVSVPVRRAAGESGSLHVPYAVAGRLLELDLPTPVPEDSPERLLARLDQLAADGPQLLVVDDVHRADAATLALLERVAGAAADLRLAVVLAREPTPERAFLSRILRRDGCLEIELAPLDALDLDGLVREHTRCWPALPVLTADTVTIVEPLQILIDDRIVAFDDGGQVAFSHDAWRTAVYADIPVPMRAVLHRAAADRVQPARRPHHLVSAGAPAPEVLAGLTRATEPLGHAPAVEADLLARWQDWSRPTGTRPASWRCAGRGRSRARASSGGRKRWLGPPCQESPTPRSTPS